MATKKENRCWPGYEPVPGKEEHSEGSCRPKAESKTTPSAKEIRAKRKQQLDKWQREHPNTKRSAAQHLSKPEANKGGSKPLSTTRKKSATASKKRAAKKRA